MTARAVASTEGPTAPILLSLYDQAGLAGRAELTPDQALRLAADLLGLALAKHRTKPAAPRRQRNDHHPPRRTAGAAQENE